jgi:hypothetical protein
VHGLIALVFLQIVSASFAGTRNERSLRDGADIAAFRQIASAGLAVAELHEAYRDFVHRFPDSSLAEVALARCIAEGEEADTMLADLKPLERNHLVSSYRQHYQNLAANRADGPAVTWIDEGPEALPRRAEPVQTRRNMRKSSR